MSSSGAGTPLSWQSIPELRFMTYHFLLFNLLWICLPLVRADNEFTPAETYPIGHYREIWNKNPFTLKTAPSVLKKESFAKDLVLGSMVQYGDEMLVVIVNTKTRERIQLVSGLLTPDGMRIKSANLQDNRADSSVEIEFNGDMAVLRYDEAFQKQLASSSKAMSSVANPPIALAADLKNSSDADLQRGRRRRETASSPPQ